MSNFLTPGKPRKTTSGVLPNKKVNIQQIRCHVHFALRGLFRSRGAPLSVAGSLPFRFFFPQYNFTRIVFGFGFVFCIVRLWFLYCGGPRWGFSSGAAAPVMVLTATREVTLWFSPIAFLYNSKLFLICVISSGWGFFGCFSNVGLFGCFRLEGHVGFVCLESSLTLYEIGCVFDLYTFVNAWICMEFM